MFPINDPVLRLAILGYLIRCIDAGEFQTLVEAGFAPGQLEVLRQRPASDLSHMIDMGLPIEVHIDPAQLQAVAERFDATLRHVTLMDYFLVNGACPDLVATLWRRSSAEIRERLALILDAQRRRSRASARPTEVDRESIRAAWPAIAAGHENTVERLFAIHHQEVAHLRIDDVCRVIDEAYGSFHVVPDAGGNGHPSPPMQARQ